MIRQQAACVALFPVRTNGTHFSFTLGQSIHFIRALFMPFARECRELG